MATDPVFMQTLPAHIQSGYPARMTKKSGLDLLPLAMLRTCAQAGMGFGPFANMLKELHKRRYDIRQRDYLSWHCDIKAKSGALSQFRPTPELFVDFDVEYGGCRPSGGYLRTLYIRDAEDSNRNDHYAKVHRLCLQNMAYGTHHSFYLLHSRKCQN